MVCKVLQNHQIAYSVVFSQGGLAARAERVEYS